MSRLRTNPTRLPALPPRMSAPDGDAIRQLALCVRTIHGRAQAHELASYYERALELNAHNAKVAGEALAMLREALQELEA